MKRNKILLITAFIGVFVLGVTVGFIIKSADNGWNQTDINPFPNSCAYNGTTYKSGQSFPAEDGCNSCSCDNGAVSCTFMGCK